MTGEDWNAGFGKYSPDQARDDHGRFVAGGGVGSAQRAAESAAALKHEIQQVAIGAAILAAVAIGTALAPEASVVAGVVGVSESVVAGVGGYVASQATRVANGMLQSAGLSAANQILKGMGVDTSKAEAVVRQYNELFKSADGETSLLAALRAPLSSVADQAVAALKAKLQTDHSTSPRLGEALKGVDVALSDYKKQLARFGKSTVPLFADMTYSQRMEREAQQFREIATDLAKLAEVADDGRAALRKMGGGTAEAALADMAAMARKLSDTLDRMASAPIPLCLQPSSTTQGSA